MCVFICQHNEPLNIYQRCFNSHMYHFSLKNFVGMKASFRNAHLFFLTLIPSWNSVFFCLFVCWVFFCGSDPEVFILFIYFIHSFKELLRKENIVIVHFNWSLENKLVLPAHPEVKRVFHYSNIFFFFVVISFMQIIMRALFSTLGFRIECYVPMNPHCVLICSTFHGMLFRATFFLLSLFLISF